MKSLFGLSAANALYMFAWWALFAAVAKAGDATMAGGYSVVLAWASPVFMFFMFHLRALTMANPVRPHWDGRTVLAVRLAASLVAYVISILLIQLYVNEDGWIPLALLLAVLSVKLSENFSDIAVGILQRHGWVGAISIGMLIRGFALLAACAAGLILQSVDALLAVMAVGVGLSVLAWELPKVRAIVAREPEKSGREAADSARVVVRQGMFGGVATLAWALNSNVPVILADRALTPVDVGRFAGVYIFLNAALRAVVPIAQYAMSNIARMQDDQSARSRARGHYWRLAVSVTLAVMAGLFVLGAISDSVLPLIYTSEYTGLGGAVRVCAVVSGLAVTASFLSYYLILKGAMAAHLAACIVAICATAVMFLVYRPGSIEGIFSCAGAGFVGYAVFAAVRLVRPFSLSGVVSK